MTRRITDLLNTVEGGKWVPSSPLDNQHITGYWGVVGSCFFNTDSFFPSHDEYLWMCQCPRHSAFHWTRASDCTDVRKIMTDTEGISHCTFESFFQNSSSISQSVSLTFPIAGTIVKKKNGRSNWTEELIESESRPYSMCTDPSERPELENEKLLLTHIAQCSDHS